MIFSVEYNLNVDFLQIKNIKNNKDSDYNFKRNGENKFVNKFYSKTSKFQIFRFISNQYSNN